VVGDLEDLRERAAEAGAEVVIGSSHTVATAEAIGATPVPLGLPADHRFGAALSGVTGYRGGLRFITELANAALTNAELTHHRHLPPTTTSVRALSDPFPPRKDLP
jgi:nitrogenase molybdenum-iron protein alpha/beta subunit